ncbi:MAG TPA: periplasmic heavy metal sensor [Prolixibacteraceae bacterium]|jgi:Spy/CpxP family protein refolding chaperone|nr:periplasmic heavy metal sensor [Prolixibacteraceae bacterium]
MNTMTKQRLLVGLIVVLIATNLSTIGSFYYHRFSEQKKIEAELTTQASVPGEQRTRYFRDQLGLSDEQTNSIREINRSFNRSARTIESKLAELRQEIVGELGQSNSDTVRLKNIAAEIGNNHRELKELTTKFYLDMKKVCSPEQQKKLHTIFQSMLNKENQVNLPQPGYQRGRGRNR